MWFSNTELTQKKVAEEEALCIDWHSFGSYCIQESGTCVSFWFFFFASEVKCFSPDARAFDVGVHTLTILLS